MKKQHVTSHKEKIKCPRCGCKQMATVFHTIPFATFIHNCKRCDYTIMESDWDRVETKTPIKP